MTPNHANKHNTRSHHHHTISTSWSCPNWCQGAHTSTENKKGKKRVNMNATIVDILAYVNPTRIYHNIIQPYNNVLSNSGYNT